MNTINMSFGFKCQYGMIGDPEVNLKVAVDVVSGLLEAILEFQNEDGINRFRAYEDILVIESGDEQMTMRAPSRDMAIFAIEEYILQNAIYLKLEANDVSLMLISHDDIIPERCLRCNEVEGSCDECDMREMLEFNLSKLNMVDSVCNG
jgi:hypothetical protein